MLPTLEKAMSVALFFEQYYHALLKPPTKAQSNAAHPGNYVLNRARRLASLEATFHLPENRFMSEGEKDSRREELMQEENRMLRDRRRKVDVKAFELGRVIGHGAFGVVRIGRERQTGRLVAMKQVSSPLAYLFVPESMLGPAGVAPEIRVSLVNSPSYPELTLPKHAAQIARRSRQSRERPSGRGSVAVYVYW